MELSNLSGTLLAGNKNHLLNQARSDLARKEIPVESLNKCIDDLQKRTEVQDRALQEVPNEFVESRREQTRLQYEFFTEEESSSGYADSKQARNGKNEEGACTYQQDQQKPSHTESVTSFHEIGREQ